MDTAQWFASCATQIRDASPCPIPPDLHTRFPLPLDPAQTRAVSRLLGMLSRYGGALLADVTGLGKTRTAAATALCWLHSLPRAGTVLCCVPARQLQRWKSLWSHIPTKHTVVFCTHTALSRGWQPDYPVDLILVDEAHHFRHATTKRTARLAKLAAAGASLLLITATPICNDPKDLYTLLRLFLGEHDTLDTLGFTLKEAFDTPHTLQELAMALIVRRERLDETGSPLTKRPGLKLHTLSYAPSKEEAYIWQNLSTRLNLLTLSALSTSWPPQLFTQFMLRRWESGPLALKTSLQALILWHQKMLAHLRNPHMVPPPDHFTASAPDLLLQESLFLSSSAQPPPQVHLPDVRHDLQILEDLLQRLAMCDQKGCGRTQAILEMLAQHPDQKFLLFTSHVDAAHDLFTRITTTLGPLVQVGCVTGRGAKVTGIGKIAYEEVMRRFSPISQGVITPLPSHQHVQILVATDCISEGVNLQDCGHVVLVDLPYSPLQVEQRIGRLIRPGNPHHTVTVTLPRPLAWPDSLGMRHTITKKVHAATACATPYVHAPLLAKSSKHLPSQPPSCILEHLDLRDQLLHHWSTLSASPPHPPPHPAWFHVPTSRKAFWVFYKIHPFGTLHLECFCSPFTPEPLSSWAAIAMDLVEHPLPLVRLLNLPAHPHILCAQNWLEAQMQRRRQGALTSPSCSLSSPQVLLWRRVIGAKIPPAVREDLQGRLARAYPLGVEARLDTLLDAEVDKSTLIRLLFEALPHPWLAKDISIDVLGGLSMGSGP